MVAGREVDRVRLAGRPRRGVVHEQLRCAWSPAAGGAPRNLTTGLRRGDRRARARARLDARQHGARVLRAREDGRPRLPRERSTAGSRRSRAGPRWTAAPSLDAHGRDARVPARGLGDAARGVDAQLSATAARGRSATRRPRPRRRRALTDTNPQVRELLVVPEGARDLEGRRRPGHGGPARLPARLREGRSACRWCSTSTAAPRARTRTPSRPRRASGAGRCSPRRATRSSSRTRAAAAATARRSAPPTCATGASRTTRTS